MSRAVAKKASNPSFFISTQKSKACKWNDYNTSNITWVFLFVQIFASGYLITKYFNTSDPLLQSFRNQNLAVFAFSAIGLMLNKYFVGSRQAPINAFITLVYGFGGFAAVAISQVIVISLTKISISDFDLYLFFTATAIGEEFLFRFGILPSLERWSKSWFMNTPGCDYYAGIFSIVISSGIFALYHLFVKESVALLLAVLVSGLILGVVLRISKSIDACLIAHVLVNLFATFAQLNPALAGIVSGVENFFGIGKLIIVGG